MKIKENQVLAGSGWDVRHIVLEGSHYDIGRILGELARERHGVVRTKTPNELGTKARRRYYERNYPFMTERMKGLAAVYHCDLEDDQYDFSVLGQPVSGLNCSAVYYPLTVTDHRHGLLSKNLDFIAGGPLNRPYIIELRPEQGCASLAIMSFELMGQRLEGINSEGLTVIHLSDDETQGLGLMEPAGEDGVGISELQAVELLLDTCSTTEEAKEVLLMNKHYYQMLPVHLLVADRTGRAFIWEFSSNRNREVIIDLGEQPQVITNFLLHRHSDTSLPIVTEERCCMFNRYRALEGALKQHDGAYTLKTIHSIIDHGVVDKLSFADENPVRTLWQELWDIEERSLEIRFSLGEDNELVGGERTRFSQRFKFYLR